MYHNTCRPQPHQEECFVAIQVSGVRNGSIRGGSQSRTVDFTAMKLFDRFRKIVMRFIFSFPPSSSSSRRPKTGGSGSACSRYGDGPDPPKTSCSSYYSSNSHYSEAIADCIEFFNKSSSSPSQGEEDGTVEGRNSDFV